MGWTPAGFWLQNPTTTEGFTVRPSYGANTVDADDEAVALICYTPVEITIRKIGKAHQTTTTGGTGEYRVETVSSGFPSGTLWATDTNVTETLLGTDDNVYLEGTLTADAVITAGSWFAIVYKRPTAGAIVTQLRYHIGYAPPGIPYGAIRTTSWAASANTPIFFLYDDTGAAIDILGTPPFWNNTNVAFNSGSTPDDQGNVWNLPIKVRISHVHYYADQDGDGLVNFYDSDGVTKFTTGAISASIPNTAGGSYNTLPLDDTVEWEANTDYRVTIEPTSGSNITLNELISPTSDNRARWPCGGGTVKKTTAKDPSGVGSWTDSPTSIFQITVFISEIWIPDGGSGGGLLTHPGMNGGFRG